MNAVAVIEPAVAGSATAHHQAGWRNVSVEQQFVVRGGACAKPHVIETKAVSARGGDKMFCKVGKTEFWLHKCVGGKSATKGVMKRCTVFDEMRNKISQQLETPAVAGGATPAVAGVADDSQETRDDDVDPMDALDAIEDAPLRQAKKRRKRASENILTIQMPERPRIVNASAADSRAVDLFCAGNHKTTTLWLGMEHIPWLVNYVGAEVYYGGVPLLDPVELPEPSAVAEGNCNVLDLYIEWDWETDSWVAEFVAGPLVGERVTSKLDTFTQAKWDALEPARDVAFEDADVVARKDGLRDYVLSHCASMLAARVADSSAVADE